MSDQTVIHTCLHKAFLEKRKRNASFSLRAFAKQLGISSGNLSEILRGNRKISRKLVERIIERLAISPEEAGELIKIFPQKNEKQPKDSKNIYSQISMDQYHAIADWYHFAILSLAETDNFKSDPKWIANRLGIKIQEANSSMERLLRLGLLIKDKKGGIRPTGKKFSTSEDISNISLRKSHYQNLELALSSLDKDEVTIRDFSSVTMAIDPAKLPEAKKRIRNFYRQLARHLEKSRKKQVYRFCGQLIPLTRGVIINEEDL